jgi:hypothetical protein
VTESIYHELLDSAAQVGAVEAFEIIDNHCIDEAVTLLEQIKPTLDSVERLPLRHCVVPVRFQKDFFDHHMNDLQQLRKLSWAFQFAANVSAYRGDYKETARYGMVLLDLANAVRRGGLVVDYLIAVAFAGCAVERLRVVRKHFTNDVCRELITTIARYDIDKEPFDEIAERDALWETETDYYEANHTELSDDYLLDPASEIPIEDQRIAIETVKEFSNLPQHDRQIVYAHADFRTSAMARLLAVDLAVRCWKSDNGRYPKTLAALAPKVMSDVPCDPFTGNHFIYRLQHDSFTLYSTGPDGKDRGGKFGSYSKLYSEGYDLSLDCGDYEADAWDNPEPEGALGRLWARIKFSLTGTKV